MKQQYRIKGGGHYGVAVYNNKEEDINEVAV